MMRPLLNTRPRSDGTLTTTLRRGGVMVTDLPMIDIEAVTPPEPPPEAELYLFTSRYAVQYGVPLVTVPVLQTARVWAVGEATAAALGEQGVAVDITSPNGGVTYFLDHHLTELATTTVCVVKGVGGRRVFSTRVREVGGTVTTVSCYRRLMPTFTRTERALVLANDWYLLATSVTTIRHLATLIGETAEALAWRRRQVIVALDQRIITAAQQMGWTGSRHVVIDACTAEAIARVMATPNRGILGELAC